jgi:hypothetical protein
MELIKAFEAASNREDTDAVLDMFVDEGWSYHVWGGHATDRHSLRYYLDFLAGHANPKDEYEDCQPDGEGVTCTWAMHGPPDGGCNEAIGVGVIHFRITFVFQDGKIQSVVGDITSEEKPSVSAAIGKKNEWAAANRPEMFEELLAGFGAPADRSGRDWAEIDLDICREYEEATGGQARESG